MIGSIADTARWVAHHRIAEDPFAARLAGERGAAVARELHTGDALERTLRARTRAIDSLLLEAIRAHDIDCVINLAAGLDARPYRLDLPRPLRWVEIDLPALLEEKSRLLDRDSAFCALESVSLDLTDRPARRAFLSRIATSARRSLVLTEGLLVYFDRGAVADLARDLSAQPTIGFWITDLVGPVLLRGMRRAWKRKLAGAGADLQFGPVEGAEFFRTYGWSKSYVRVSGPRPSREASFVLLERR